MLREILVIREKDRFSSILIEQGFSVTNFALVKTEPLADLSELENCVAKIENFDGVFITSVKAAQIVAAKMSVLQRNFRGKFFVLGKRSNDLLKKFGFEIFFDEKATTVKELLESIPKEDLINKKILLARGNRSLRVVPEALKDIAIVTETVVYETVDVCYGENEVDEIGKKLRKENFAAVCFFSPSGVESFLVKFENFSPGKTKIAAIGKTTARFADENNLRVDFVSANPSADKFASELIDYLRN